MTNPTILVCGEAWGREEALRREPFVGPSGRLLHGMLAAAGISKKDCYFTNAFNLKPEPKDDISNLCGSVKEGIPGLPPIAQGKYILAKYEPELHRLWQEVRAVDPNLILAVGGTALWALTKQKHPISKDRGALTQSWLKNPVGEPYKILPTYHPAAVMREWSLRPIVHADLAKALRHSHTRTFDRPKRELWIQPSIEDIKEFYFQFIMPNLHRPCGVDIETDSGTITEISFCYPERGIVIPFFSRVEPDGNYWRSFEEEIAAWNLVAHILFMLTCPVFQNGLYDLNYLWRTAGIIVPHAGEDTMLLHHSLQPELQKGLGFLGSIHTDEPSWKLMRQETFKKEE